MNKIGKALPLFRGRTDKALKEGCPVDLDLEF
jgi:hypothetical protein